MACIDILGVKRTLNPFRHPNTILIEENHEIFGYIIGPLSEYINDLRKKCNDLLLAMNTKKANISFFSDSIYVGIPFGKEVYQSIQHSKVLEGIANLPDFFLKNVHYT